jgi:sterol desaturase/sphingolipid hydroxylase (fatty acid hydroxylase superfamily)
MELYPKIRSEAGELGSHLADKAWATLTTPSTTLSIASLATALLVAGLWVVRTNGPRRLRVLQRALFPRRWLFGPSARIDWTFAVFNTLLIGLALGGAVLSATGIADALSATLAAVFGAINAPLLSGWAATLATTLLLYLTFEAAYFLQHYAAHRIPLLWHFHRPHHLAETLGPATFYRVHPVDSVIYLNVVAVFLGAMGGLCIWLFPGADAMTLWGNNAFIALAAFLILPLQHSHIWLPTTGWLGRVIFSPAHHQLHHSDDPRHHNTNYGNSLALFDWLAGTLCVPDRKRPRLVFGAGEYGVDPHTLWGAWVQPFVEAWRIIGETLQRRRASAHSPAEATAVELTAPAPSSTTR